ncbi:hypothetical protein COCCADRAFT_108020, partial [Bipolaris zeicola 26-R-13]
ACPCPLVLCACPLLALALALALHLPGPCSHSPLPPLPSSAPLATSLPPRAPARAFTLFGGTMLHSGVLHPFLRFTA